MAAYGPGAVMISAVQDNQHQPPTSVALHLVSLPGCAVAVSAGRHFSLALLADGTIYSWGLNNYGQLGNNNAPTSNYQAQQVNGITTAIAVSAGGEHAMALLSGGTVKIWGEGSYGQMGNGTSGVSANINAIPVTAAATGFLDIIKIAAGYSHCMALKSNNDVYLWGDNNYGQLGRGNAPNPSYTLSATPIKSSDMSGGTILDISAGAGFSIVLRNDNKTLGCGANGRYEIGVCKSTTKYPKPQFGPEITNAIDLWTPSTGQQTLCVTSTGKLYGWGDNSVDQLGIGGSPTKVCAPGVLINDAAVIGEDGYYCLAKPSSDNYPQPCCVSIQESNRTEIEGTYSSSPNNINFYGQNLAITGPIVLTSGNHYINSSDVVCTKDASITNTVLNKFSGLKIRGNFCLNRPI